MTKWQMKGLDEILNSIKLSEYKIHQLLSPTELCAHRVFQFSSV